MSSISVWGNIFIISAIVQGAIITGFTILTVAIVTQLAYEIFFGIVLPPLCVKILLPIIR
jgi:hypothetical protein